MLGIWGIVTIVVLLFLVIKKLVSPVVALVLVPVVTGLLAGFGTELANFIGTGLKDIAPTGVMFIFAILFFGILLDAGTFAPIIKSLLKFAGNSPIKIAIATALLAMLIHLDGSGAVTFLVVIPAMLPIYEAMGMRRTTLATIVALAAGTMNILPWGGPTLRAATSLGVPVTDLFNPILVPVLAGLMTVLGIAYWLGKKEAAHISQSPKTAPVSEILQPETAQSGLNQIRFILNILMILVSISALIASWAPPYVVFMVAFALALLLNYPKVDEQKQRIDAHAKEAMLMASILFAAGCFTGILKGTGMITAMAASIESIVPPQVGGQLPLITGLLAMPASLLFDPDSFYFGILPLLTGIGNNFGIEAVAIGRTAIMGQMTTGFAVSPLTGSTFLLIGLARVDLGSHQLKTIPLAYLVSLVILFVSILLGITPI
jgi:citrate-Mg2+:H+ or citrate-Ca2+:H+ symporter, CitMHS family